MEKAAKQKEKDAEFLIGYCYEVGYGISKDIDKAFYWYERSAQHGNSAAQWVLADDYFYGDIVQQDYQKAIYWYKKRQESRMWIQNIN